jgi:hypothetical protein
VANFGDGDCRDTVQILKGNLLNNGGDVKEDDKADHEDKEGASEWQEGFSADIHKLIVTVARKCCTNDNKEDSDDCSLQCKNVRLL